MSKPIGKFDSMFNERNKLNILSSVDLQNGVSSNFTTFGTTITYGSVSKVNIFATKYNSGTNWVININTNKESYLFTKHDGVLKPTVLTQYC